MDVALPQAIFGRRPDRLRYQESRRVEQMAIVYAKFAADRRLDPEPQANRMGPDRTLILSSDVACNDSRSTENIFRGTENISAIIEWNDPDRA